MAWKANVKGNERRQSRPKTPSPNPQKLAKGTPPTLQVIADIEKKREQRRQNAALKKEERKKENRENEKLGRPGDVDFQRMIKQYRAENKHKKQPHMSPGETKINICVRKRPINKKELKRKDHDSITILNPISIVHDSKLKVDGITKYLVNNEFVFDHTFDEESTNDQVYKYTAKPLVSFIFREKGRATVFAYGQTGSGKTFTMEGIQRQAIADIFREQQQLQAKQIDLAIGVSFFEIYGGRCQDLLHERRRLTVREDGKGIVQIAGLEECVVNDPGQLLKVIEKGNRLRTTHATEVNDQSSRSHGICQICIRDRATGNMHGKLSLIDLAGSERGADTKHHNRQRRMESAEINKSLLALKECIRALDSRNMHVPFRASKLTLVLKDSFVNTNARTVMIAAVSPCASSSDHSLNTLRYADRVKEKKGGVQNLPPTPIIDASDITFEEAPSVPAAHDIRHSSPPKSSHLMPPPPPTYNDGKVKAQNDEVESGKRDSVSSQDDIRFLHDSLRIRSADNDDENLDVEELHETVQSIYEQEEQLLFAHMNSIQENAELLTEEGTLLASIQGNDVVDYDIDAYCARLEQILERKAEIILSLRSKLSKFRGRLQDEEKQSKKLNKLPLY